VVLRALVGTLLVLGRWVVEGEEELDQILEASLVSVKFQVEHLHVRGEALLHLLVSWVCQGLVVGAHEAHCVLHNAFGEELLEVGDEVLLGAPVTPRPESGSLEPGLLVESGDDGGVSVHFSRQIGLSPLAEYLLGLKCLSGELCKGSIELLALEGRPFVSDLPLVAALAGHNLVKEFHG